MKEINQEQLLKLSNVEKCEVLKAIILGKIKYIGNDNKWQDIQQLWNRKLFWNNLKKVLTKLY